MNRSCSAHVWFARSKTNSKHELTQNITVPPSRKVRPRTVIHPQGGRVVLAVQETREALAVQGARENRPPWPWPWCLAQPLWAGMRSGCPIKSNSDAKVLKSLGMCTIFLKYIRFRFYKYDNVHQIRHFQCFRNCCFMKYELSWMTWRIRSF